jgi:hypothetical protein
MISGRRNYFISVELGTLGILLENFKILYYEYFYREYLDVYI